MSLLVLLVILALPVVLGLAIAWSGFAIMIVVGIYAGYVGTDTICYSEALVLAAVALALGIPVLGSSRMSWSKK